MDCRARAKEVLTKVESMKDAQTPAKEMREIAADYERLAERLEKNQAGRTVRLAQRHISHVGNPTQGSR